MVLSKRERMVALCVLAVVVLLALDRLAFEPLLDRAAALRTQITLRQAKLDETEKLIRRGVKAQPRWEQMVAAGLSVSATEAEGQALHRVRDWATEPGVSLSSVKPERIEKDGDFVRIGIRATGTGSMSRLSRFLYSFRTATVPVRINELTITSRKDGTDDLAVQMALASTCLAPQAADKPMVLAASTGGPAYTPAVSRESFRDLFSVLSDHNIFLRNRARPAPPPTRIYTPPPPRLPEQFIVLTGIVQEDDEYRAYIENTESGRLTKVRLGDAIARGHIVQIDIDAVAYEVGGQWQWVMLGQNFMGAATALSRPPMFVARSNPPATGPSTAPTTGPSDPTAQPPPTVAGDPNDPSLSIEERMRLRRMLENQK